MGISLAPGNDTDAGAILRRLVENGPATAADLGQELFGCGRTRTTERSMVGNHLQTMLQLQLVQRTQHVYESSKRMYYVYEAMPPARALVASWPPLES